MGRRSGNLVRVEPSKAPNAPGGVKWSVVVNGHPSTSHNHKKTAVKKARQKARAKNAKLEILNKNMTVSRSANHR